MTTLTTIKAHFDGKVIVPDEPVDLLAGTPVTLRVESIVDEPVEGESVLDWIANHPLVDDDLPSDLAHQHDHYLYGTPKKPDFPK